MLECNLSEPRVLSIREVYHKLPPYCLAASWEGVSIQARPPASQSLRVHSIVRPSPVSRPDVRSMRATSG